MAAFIVSAYADGKNIICQCEYGQSRNPEMSICCWVWSSGRICGLTRKRVPFPKRLFFRNWYALIFPWEWTFPESNGENRSRIRFCEKHWSCWTSIVSLQCCLQRMTPPICFVPLSLIFWTLSMKPMTCCAAAVCRLCMCGILMTGCFCTVPIIPIRWKNCGLPCGGTILTRQTKKAHHFPHCDESDVPGSCCC